MVQIVDYFSGSQGLLEIVTGVFQYTREWELALVIYQTDLRLYVSFTTETFFLAIHLDWYRKK